MIPRPFFWGALIFAAGILIQERLKPSPLLIFMLSAIWVFAFALALIERRQIPGWSLLAGVILAGMAAAWGACGASPQPPAPPEPFTFTSREGQLIEVRVTAAPSATPTTAAKPRGEVKLRGIVVSHPEVINPGIPGGDGAKGHEPKARAVLLVHEVEQGQRYSHGQGRLHRGTSAFAPGKDRAEIAEGQAAEALVLVGRKVLLDIRKEIAPFPGAPGIALGYGDEVFLQGFLRLPGGPRNPQDVDMRKLLARKGIAATVYVRKWDEFRILRRGTGNPVMRLASLVRGRLMRVNHETLPPLEASIMDGILLGVKPQDGKVRRIIEDAGALHLFAVSGLNVGIIGGIAHAIAGALGLSGWGAWAVSSLIVSLYVLSVGLGASCVRAGIMFLCTRASAIQRSKAARRSVAGSGVMTEWDPLNGLGIAALALLIWNPSYLFDAGFLLSFTATLGVVGLAPRIKGLLKALGNSLSSALSISAGAQLAVWPILAHFFGRVTWWGIISNVVLVPLASLATTLGFAAAGLGLAFLPVARALNASNFLVIKLLLWTAGLWSEAPPLPGFTAAPPLWFVCIYYGIIISLLGLEGAGIITLFRVRLRAFLIRLWIRNPKKAIPGLIVIIIALSLGILAGFSSLGPGFRPAPQVTFLSCGQGDCALAVTPGGYTILIDGGGQTDFDVGREIVIPYLRRKGMDKIDIMILSHPHEDHVAGLVPVLEELGVRLVLDAGQPVASEIYEKFLETIDARNVSYRKVRRGAEVNLPDGSSVKILHPPRALLSGTGSDVNNNSIVARLSLGGLELLFTGDIESEGQASLLRSGADIRSDVLKVPHHGASGLAPDLVRAVDPSVAVISVGPNSFGHPDSITLRTLQSAGVKIFRTDEVGGVVIDARKIRKSLRG